MSDRFSTVSTVITWSHRVILIGTKRWRGGCQYSGVAEPAGTCWALCPTLILPTQLKAELNWFQRMKTRCVLRQVHCTAMSQGETSSLVGVKVGKRWMFPLFHLQNRVTLLASQRALSLNICMFSLKKANAIIFMNSGCNTVQWCEARWITQDLMDAFYQNYVLMQPHILLGLRQEEHPA